MANKKTALYPLHQKSKATFVDFAGVDLPLCYDTQITEHHAVRKHVGMFDVSHMCVLDLHGHDAKLFLSKLLSNDIAKITTNQALYGCMLNEHGGIIDDLITYQLAENHYRMVVNAATAEKDIAWIKQHMAEHDVGLDVREDLSIIAVQGPKARDTLMSVLDSTFATQMGSLKSFQCHQQEACFIARTGYTGEDGYELILPHQDAIELWQALLNIGVMPCGLGARDTLRLEAGLCLYGTDMTDNTTPHISNLGFTVSLSSERDFIGKAALCQANAQPRRQQLVGLILNEKGVLRAHQAVHDHTHKIGETTSGTYSPTLGKGIALARLNTPIPEQVYVNIRGKMHQATVVKPPFIRFGQHAYTPLPTNHKETP